MSSQRKQSKADLQLIAQSYLEHVADQTLVNLHMLPVKQSLYKVMQWMEDTQDHHLHHNDNAREAFRAALVILTDIDWKD